MGEPFTDINQIKKLVKDQKVIWRNHMLARMRQRRIRIDDVINCILTGEVIEHYPLDYPYPSYLVLGRSGDNQALHVVCAVGQGRVWMISTYKPDHEHWNEDFKTRRDKKR